VKARRLPPPEPVAAHARRKRRGRSPPQPIVFSPNQERALAAAKRGANIFLTGGAGTGKSFILEHIVSALRARYHGSGLAVGVAASTGVAALNVHGTTIHALLGTKICGNILQASARLRDLQKAAQSPWGSDSRDSLPLLKRRIGKLGAIVVDEVSMLTGDYVDMMCWWLQEMRASDAPFGGLQVIFCGDYMQLPPVIKRGDRVVTHFGFASDAWRDAGMEVVALQKVFRQDDRHFVGHLKRVRFGELPEDTRSYFSECVGREFEREPTRLFATNREVDMLNRKMLDLLPGPEHEYVADVRAPTPELRKRLLRDAYVEEVICLRKGADVLLARNKYDDVDGERIYVNGDRGTVMSMDEKCATIRLLRTDEDITVRREEWALERIEPDGSRKKLAYMTQLPLKLAWAVSIHKAQGQSLDPVEVDLDRCFEKGQAYVALSRARRYEGLRLVGPVEERHVMVHPECAEFHRAVEG